jgi:hypothetical protein
MVRACVDDGHPSEPLKPNGWLQRTVFECQEVYKRNLGLLLVVGSQVSILHSTAKVYQPSPFLSWKAFLSAVNVAVKKLNSLDPPVTTLQVCKNLSDGLRYVLTITNSWCLYEWYD